MTLLKEIKFDAHGLVPAIAQDEKSNEVLMMAYMNEEAVKMTVETGKAHYYSRSRKKLWMKGESSGHVQEVSELLIDCDGDTLLLKVAQKVAACHTGHYSCFFRRAEGDAFGEIQEKTFNEDEVYGKGD